MEKKGGGGKKSEGKARPRSPAPAPPPRPPGRAPPPARMSPARTSPPRRASPPRRMEGEEGASRPPSRPPPPARISAATARAGIVSEKGGRTNAVSVTASAMAAGMEREEAAGRRRPGTGRAEVRTIPPKQAPPTTRTRDGKIDKSSTSVNRYRAPRFPSKKEYPMPIAQLEEGGEDSATSDDESEENEVPRQKSARGFFRPPSQHYMGRRSSIDRSGGQNANVQLYPVRIGFGGPKSDRISRRNIGAPNMLFLMEGAGQEENDELKKIRTERLERVNIGSFYTLLYVVLTAIIFTFGGYEVYRDRGWFGFAIFLILVPIAVPIALFYYKSFIACFYQVIGPIKQAKRNSKYYSCFTPEPWQGELPKITIQMPVYRESLNQTIKPSIQSLYHAIWDYRSRGGEANLFINDDGLQVLNEKDRQARIDFYEMNKISYIARPPENRKGLFKKASNMNFCLNISKRVEDMVLNTDKTPEEALKIIQEQDGNFISGGNVLMGQFILLVDSDTRVPEKCLYQTLGEFKDERLAYTQHLTSAMPLGDSHWDDMISQFTNMIYDLGIRTECANGDSCPLVGHNAVLRWEAIQRGATRDPVDGYWLYWSENNVSEDFDLSLRMQIKGYFGRYVTHTGPDFQEGVSLTFHDEMIRLRKYAYGACETLINPFKYWLVRGPISPLWLRVMRTSTIKWSSKINILSYLSSFLAMAAAIYFTILGYTFSAFFKEYDWVFGTDGNFRVFLAVQVLFAFLLPISTTLYLFRLETNKIGIFYILWRQIKFIPLMACLFGGVLWHLTTSAFAYMMSIKIVWGATVKEIPDTNALHEIIELFRRYWKMYLMLALFLAYLVYLMYLEYIPINFVTLLPGGFYIGLHLLAPILLNPYLVRIEY